MKDPKLIRFSYYGSAIACPGPTLADLLELAKEQALFARAEFSGSEGCYVEVARWRQGEDCHSGQWCRYAFEKFFGGEDLTLEEQDALTKDEHNARCKSHATAERLADLINAAADNRYISVVHKMPNW